MIHQITPALNPDNYANVEDQRKKNAKAYEKEGASGTVNPAPPTKTPTKTPFYSKATNTFQQGLTDLAGAVAGYQIGSLVGDGAREGLKTVGAPTVAQNFGEIAANQVAQDGVRNVFHAATTPSATPARTPKPSPTVKPTGNKNGNPRLRKTRKQQNFREDKSAPLSNPEQSPTSLLNPNNIPSARPVIKPVVKPTVEQPPEQKRSQDKISSNPYQSIMHMFAGRGDIRQSSSDKRQSSSELREKNVDDY